jgi:hypothetical protein
MYVRHIPYAASYWHLAWHLVGIWLASGWHLVGIWLAFAWHWFGIASGKTALACFPIPHSQQHRVFVNLASFVIAPLGV